ncbi:MAG: XRE family transcriptional regulator [Streptosporangiaceae bacterium]
MPGNGSALTAALPRNNDQLGPERGVVQLGATRQELALAREIRAGELVAGTPPAQIAGRIWAQCGPAFGTTRIRACRLALGIALADVVAQVRAWYAAEGRRAPRFSETLLSAYESGQKRPGPEYLHYLCAAYRAEPADLGYEGRCLCGRGHSAAGPAPDGEPSRRPRPAGFSALRSAVVPESQPADAGESRPAGVPESQPAGVPESQPAGVPESQPADAGHGQPAARARPAADADDDALRAMALRLTADVGTPVDGRFLGAVDRIRRRLDDALLAATVSATMIDRWEEAIAAYGRQYLTAPPLPLLCDALLDLGDVRRRCEDRQPIEFAERLCRVAGELSGLAGIIMVDLGDQRLARSFFRTARAAADETGDRRLRAWVAAREALAPLYYGDPREAAALASAAVDLAGRHQCAAAVLAPAIAARAWARLAGRPGRREVLSRVRATFDRAREALADLPAADRADTAFGYTEWQLLCDEGDALVMLGDCQAAERAFDRASRLCAPAEVAGSALVALGQARCLLGSAEPEQALQLSQGTVLGLAPGYRVPLIVHAARGIAVAAAGRYPALPGLAEYREALARC